MMRLKPSTTQSTDESPLPSSREKKPAKFPQALGRSYSRQHENHQHHLKQQEMKRRITPQKQSMKIMILLFTAVLMAGTMVWIDSFGILNSPSYVLLEDTLKSLEAEGHDDWMKNVSAALSPSASAIHREGMTTTAEGPTPSNTSIPIMVHNPLRGKGESIPSGNQQTEVSRTTLYHPHCILHIGPHKTGTTSIQQFIRDHPETFAKDGYDASMFMDSKDDGGLSQLRKCIKLNKRCSRPKSKYYRDWQNGLQTIVDRGAGQNKNILISDEELSHTDIQQNGDWKKMIYWLQQHYQVTVILVYRRYFEWLPSYYNQHYKYRGPFGSQMNEWPLDGGKEIPIFAEYLEQRLQNTVEGDSFLHLHQWDFERRRPVHPVRPIKEKLQKQGLHVKVLNLHTSNVTGGSLLETFFCSAVPRAQHTCQVAKSETPILANPSTTTYDYDRLVCAAHSNGWIKGINRRSATRQLQSLAADVGLGPVVEPDNENSFAFGDWPWLCPSDRQYLFLWEISYEAEASLAPELLPSLNASFTQAIAKHKLCNWNRTALLEMREWHSLLRALRNEP